MNNSKSEHSQMINDLKQFLLNRGKIQSEPPLDLGKSNSKYRPDLIFENPVTGIKVVVELKANDINNLNISLGTISFLIKFKVLLENSNKYKFIVVFKNVLSEDYSSILQDSVIYYTLKEKSYSDIADIIYNESCALSENK